MANNLRFSDWRDKIAATRVLVVGDVMLDRYWFGEVHRISPEAPVPVVRVAREEARPGGAANVARNIAALGGKAELLSVIGDDDAGRRLEEIVAAEAIVSHLKRDPTFLTTVKLRVIGQQQQLLRIDFEKEPSAEVLADKLAAFSELVPECDLVVISDYDKGGLKDIRAMIEVANQQDRRVLIDPKGDDWDKYRNAFIVTPNRGELQRVVGRWHNEDDLYQKVVALQRSLHLSALLLTRSEEGMTLFEGEKIAHIPTRAREVFDVSGAGDTVVAVLGVALAAGMSLVDAVHLANEAAGIVVGKFGTAVVTPDELSS